MSDDLRQRWRVQVGSRIEISEKDLPPGIVSEVSILHTDGLWAAVFTAERQHLPGLFDRALTWPGLCHFDAWEPS